MKAPGFWWQEESSSWQSGLLRPASALYRSITSKRIARAPQWKAPVPVICVGNLVAGGAGKTPTTILILQLLTEAGLKPVVLSRGYGGSEAGPLRVNQMGHTAAQVGDEPLMLASFAPVIVSRDRVAGAKLATEIGSDVIVMDDGFQNPDLHKDFNLIVIDAERGLGNGKVIPSGPLREPADKGFARAHAVLVIGNDAQQRTNRAATLPPKSLPSFTGCLKPGYGMEWVSGQRVTAFAGIANPAKFFETLDSLGADVVGKFDFPDHHPYKPADLVLIERHAKSTNSMAVTTEKDSVRLPLSARGKIAMIRVDLAVDQADAFRTMILNAAQHTNEH